MLAVHGVVEVCTCASSAGAARPPARLCPSPRPERSTLADAPAAPFPKATDYRRAFRWIVLPTPRTSATLNTVKGSVRRTKTARRLDITSCCVT